jgi:cell division protein FtsL
MVGLELVESLTVALLVADLGMTASILWQLVRLQLYAHREIPQLRQQLDQQQKQLDSICQHHPYQKSN